MQNIYYIAYTVRNILYATMYGTIFCSTVPPNEVNISITSDGEPVPGQTYVLNCTVALPTGITSSPVIQWLGSSGTLSSGEGITVSVPVTAGKVTSLVLEFDPLRVSHGGRFICEAIISTVAPPYTITEFAEYDVIVECKFWKCS